MNTRPLIRNVPSYGPAPRLKDLDKVRRTLPKKTPNSEGECFLQDEAGFSVLDEVDNLGIFDDYSSACREAESIRNPPPSTQTPFPVVHRGQRRFFNPIVGQETLQTCEEIVPVPPIPPIPPPDVPTGHIVYTECRDFVTFSWDDQINYFSGLRVETGTLPAGPWEPYLIRDDVPSSLTFANHFDGTRYIRISAKFEGEYFPFIVEKPPAPVIATPTLASTTMIVASPNAMPSLVLSFHNDGLIYPVSNHENGLIGPPGGEYVEVRQRLEYYMDPTNFTGYPKFFFTHPDPGVTIRYTTDNTEPSLVTGHAAGDFNNDVDVPGDPFSNIIRVAAFKDGCMSPELVLLVDKRTNVHPNIFHSMLTLGDSASCDLPGPSGESGASCNVLYGGTEGFLAYRKATFCSAASSPGGFAYGIWRQIVDDSVGPPVGGFSPYFVSTSYSGFVSAIWNRPAAFESYPSEVYAQASVQAGGTFNIPCGFGVTGLSGSHIGFTNPYNQLIGSLVRPCNGELPDGSLAADAAEIVTSRIPFGPVFTGDDKFAFEDFETYSDGPPVLNAGQDWAVERVIH